MSDKSLAPVLYLPHGGGPLPLLNDPAHAKLTAFLKKIGQELGRPEAILLISAHWEKSQATLTSNPHPALYFDYSGFPPETYEYRYPAPGNPALAQEIETLLQQQGIAAQTDAQRGYDHGLFVPLMLMYPKADIPCVQLSLLGNLNPEQHIALGEAIASLRERNVMVIGSGLSFHNMREFFSRRPESEQKAIEFDHWLVETCTDNKLNYAERRERLVNWTQAPQARFCHPREEHLLPLHVCFGAAGTQSQAELVFNADVAGKRASGFLWRS
ncbi:DODA-type extradiol aromatic ring-opening family dioxygenase [Thiofilum flexile]|uniref:DODA-type extradiol aromatic ring-opening family dioxygenase n=1 Tax=Thiofilum flexile TaxID=125627 RepID=UPI00037EE67D|nr:class III extradiol ring-cleavage dioxygenase [Thiofilum flexile]